MPDLSRLAGQPAQLQVGIATGRSGQHERLLRYNLGRQSGDLPQIARRPVRK